MNNITPQNEEFEKVTDKTNILLRYGLVVSLLTPIVAGILVCLFKIAYVDGNKWIRTWQKEQNREPVRVVSPNRGNIYSSDGKLMSTNMPMYELYIDFNLSGRFPKDSFLNSKRNGIDSLSHYLAKNLGDRSVDGYKTHLRRGLNSGSTEFKVSMKKVSYLELQNIKQYPFFRRGRYKSGFYEKEYLERRKLFGSLAERTIGYIDKNYWNNLSKGMKGLELEYDSLLRGETGLGQFIRVGGRWVKIFHEAPVDGYDIVTTIDTQIQDITEKALYDKVKELQPRVAISIVMEVKTGEIKAITNLIRAQDGSYSESENRAVNGQYEPGSTFKTAVMMVALEDGICTPDKILNTGNGKYEYKGRLIRDHNFDRGGYGVISAEQAFWYSSNVGMAKIVLEGYEHNAQKFIAGLERIGIFTDLKLEISGAGHPKISRPGGPEWSDQSLPRMSYGTEVQMSSIYTLAFYNAIANQGKKIRPIFTREIQREGKTVKRFKTETLIPSICSDKTLKTIQSMLTNAVEKGTGRMAYSKSVSIAGKTGTAQLLNKDGTVYGHNVSFCGYFPADHPQYSCIVFMHRPAASPSAGSMCGTVFKTIAEKVHARRSKIVVRSMKPEANRLAVPEVKNGNAKSLAYILNELDIKTSGSINSEYVSGHRNPETQTVDMKEITVRRNLVPDVTSMGAKDAVFVLEKCGLNVRLSGRGKVVSQSLPAGSSVVRGRTITIKLNN
ncbi:MAG: transpeptidase family protein [Tannerella sp.]|jgi:cell division protein FtsI (penicillin-binding protein 3)|nr:transpeptidase family protein [Tannerella sp.]